MSSRTPHLRSHRRTATQPFTPIYNSPSRTARQPLAEPRVRRIPVQYKLIIFIMIMLCMSGHFAWSQHVSAQTAAAKLAEQQLAAVQARRTAIFKQQVQELVDDHPELRLGVAVVAPGASAQQLGDTGRFDAASTGKLLTAADFLHHVERGDVSLHDQIAGLSAQKLLQRMIINSDDAAWAELNDYLGHSDIESYARSRGITDYDAETNTLTAGDTARLLQQLDTHALLSEVHRSLLLAYLAQANFRDFALPAIPSSDTVYHKIGINADAVHDAMIITNHSSSLVLTIYTDGQGTYNWQARKALMQTITKDAIAAYL